MVAADAGYRVTLSVGKPVMPQHPAADARTLDIQVTGTRPGSQFGTKHIEALLSGGYAADPAGGWESELTAEGAPRDLVHPIADALLTRIAVFLATNPAD